MGKTIPLGQISVIGNNRQNELGNELGVHLPVAIDLDDDVSIKL